MALDPANFDYAAWLKEAEDRLVYLKRQRDRLEQEILKLEQGIAAFSPLTDGNRINMGQLMQWVGHEANLTEAVRQLFRNDGRVFQPTQIRDELMDRGVGFEQKNPMAVMHQILLRLELKGEVVAVVINGKTGYQSKVANARTTGFQNRAPDKKPK